MTFDYLLSLLKLSPEQLLKQCERQNWQGSGPGGQHRNRHKTGIRLNLTNPPISTYACEYREGGLNANSALEKMRIEIALFAIQIHQFNSIDINSPPQFAQNKINLKNPLYPEFILYSIALIKMHQGEVLPIAEFWHWSASSLLKQFFKEEALWDFLQKTRQSHNKKTLFRPS